MELKYTIATYGQLITLVEVYGMLTPSLIEDRSVRAKWHQLIEDASVPLSRYYNLQTVATIKNGGQQKKDSQGNSYWGVPDVPKRAETDNDAQYTKKLNEYIKTREAINKELLKLKGKPSGVSVKPFLSEETFDKLLNALGMRFDPLYEMLVKPSIKEN